MVVVYGLRNCDTCRAAMKWLTAQGIDATLHDLRADGLDAQRLSEWADELGWEALLNRRSKTWRGLPEVERTPLDGDRARALMAAHPTLVKRPVIDRGDRRFVGFDEAVRSRLRRG